MWWAGVALAVLEQGARGQIPLLIATAAARGQPLAAGVAADLLLAAAAQALLGARGQPKASADLLSPTAAAAAAVAFLTEAPTAAVRVALPSVQMAVVPEPFLRRLTILEALPPALVGVVVVVAAAMGPAMVAMVLAEPLL